MARYSKTILAMVTIFGLSYMNSIDNNHMLIKKQTRTVDYDCSTGEISYFSQMGIWANNDWLSTTTRYVKNSKKEYNIEKYTINVVENCYWKKSTNQLFTIVSEKFDCIPLSKSLGAKGITRNNYHTIKAKISGAYNPGVYGIHSHSSLLPTENPLQFTIGLSATLGIKTDSVSADVGGVVQWNVSDSDLVNRSYNSFVGKYAEDSYSHFIFDLSHHDKRLGTVVTGEYFDYGITVFTNSYYGTQQLPIVTIDYSVKFHERVVLANYYGTSNGTFEITPTTVTTI